MSLADRWFSMFIRLRDATEHGWIYCVTCGKPVNYKYEADAGHFVPRNKMYLRYNEKNVHGQCKGCNNKHWNQGEQFAHGKYIDKKYGEGTAELLYSLRNMHAPRNKREFKIIADMYREKAKKLSKEKGLPL